MCLRTKEKHVKRSWLLCCWLKGNWRRQCHFPWRMHAYLCWDWMVRLARQDKTIDSNEEQTKHRVRVYTLYSGLQNVWTAIDWWTVNLKSCDMPLASNSCHMLARVKWNMRANKKGMFGVKSDLGQPREDHHHHHHHQQANILSSIVAWQWRQTSESAGLNGCSKVSTQISAQKSWCLGMVVVTPGHISRALYSKCTVDECGTNNARYGRLITGGNYI